VPVRRQGREITVTQAHRRTWWIGIAATGLAALLAGSGLSMPVAADTGTTFTVHPLPQATGVTYGAASGGRNEDIEPGIGVAPDGSFWVGSNIDVNTTADPRALGAVAGEDVWKSTDGGQTYQWVAAPFNLSNALPGAGGEDSDLQVATAKNANGFYNVYATSLYVAASNMAISQDGGATWTDITVGGIPAQDRPWLSTDGACVFYLTYHQLPLFSPVVNKYDICNLNDVGAGFTLNPVQSTTVFTSNTAPGLTNAFNKPFVDNAAGSSHLHNVYVPMEACNLQNPQDYFNNIVSTAEQIPTCPAGVNTQVEVAVSTDGGTTFSDYIVAQNTNGELQVWPTSLAVDGKGNVYVAWGDNHHAFFSKSADGGQTWFTKAVQLDKSPVGTVSYPTVAAGANGVVEVAYYGTSVAGDANDTKTMGTPGDPAAAPWHLYWAKSTDGGSTFSTLQVGGVNHTGVLCTMGSACAAGGARNLYDDFGIAISPTTGLASIAFDADQPMTSPPGAKAVDPFTAFATENAAPATTVPETPRGVLTVVLGAGFVGLVAVLARRRRRAQVPLG
jgi:hypothetical protein